MSRGRETSTERKQAADRLIPGHRPGAIKYYVLGAFTSAATLVGVAYLFGLAGSTTLSGLQAGLAGSGTNLAVIVGAALVVLALAFKIGAVPAHA